MGQTCDKLVADGSNRYGELAQSAVTALQACHYILVQTCAFFRLWTGRRPELRPIAIKNKGMYYIGQETNNAVKQIAQFI